MKERELASRAKELAGALLARGNYIFGGSTSLLTAGSVAPASTGSRTRSDDEDGDLAFHSLAVQAVGFEGGESPAIHVYVAKGRQDELEYRGLPVRVTRVGKVTVRPEQAAGTTNQGAVYIRSNRTCCGSSCAPAGEAYAGTMGALVRRDAGEELFVLSNNHVLAAGNHTPIGMPIMSPSSLDARPTAPAPREIARHAEICELRSGEPALVPPGQEDIAIARVQKPEVVSSWQGPQNSGYDTPAANITASSGMRVKKVGRTTGLTCGTVEALINSAFPIPYKCRYFTAYVWLTNMWTVRGDGLSAFALAGDSGSLVVTEDEKAAVGLVFATSLRGEIAYMIPMDRIRTLLGGVRTVAQHGV